MKSDLQNRDEIKVLVHSFYEKLLEDRMLKHFFLEVAQISLSEHLPIIVDFWESVLFKVGKYNRNTMQVHLDLHMEERINKAQIEQWLKLFNETVDEFYEGPNADKAKNSAKSIAIIIKMKIDNLERQRLELNN
ncbi:MAG: group III truncated hemoglobin [Bacteroidota bacterium]